jgi:hypothetical protein
MNKEEIISQIPALREELGILVRNSSYLQKNVNFLKEFAIYHNIHSEEEMNNFLLNCDSDTKEQLILSTYRILRNYKQVHKMTLDNLLDQALSLSCYEHIYDDLEFIKDTAKLFSIPFDKEILTITETITKHIIDKDLSPNVTNVKSGLIDNAHLEQTLGDFFHSVHKIQRGFATEKEEFTTIYDPLFPSITLATAILEVASNHFNQLHNYKINFYLIEKDDFKENSSLAKYISCKVNQNQNFELPIIISFGSNFAPCIIKYQDHILEAWHSDERYAEWIFSAKTGTLIEKSLASLLDTLNLYTKVENIEHNLDLNLDIGHHFLNNFWQSDDENSFPFAINFLEKVIEDINIDNNMTFNNDAVQAVKAHSLIKPYHFSINFLKHTVKELSNDNTLNDIITYMINDPVEFPENNLKYFEYTQSLSFLTHLITQAGDLTYKAETKFSDIIKNSTIVVKDNDNEVKAKAMNFAIYEYANQLYRETEKMFNSHTDEEIADIILFHQLSVDSVPGELLSLIETV